MPALLASFALASIAACSSKAQLVGSGGQCEVATDCEEGLACVPGKDGNRTCTSDLSSVQKTPQTPATDAGTPPADGSTDAAAADDAPQNPADTSTPPQDSSQPDTSSPVDSATE